MNSAVIAASPVPMPPPSPYLLRIRDLIYQVAGIFQQDHKLRLLEDRCAKRMQEVRVNSLRDYYDCLTIRPSRQQELISLLNEITIGETYFFRNQPQLDAFRKLVLPKVAAAKAKLSCRHIRIWSAGCSTGEEAYTLAILLLEEAKELLHGWTFEIAATDLNEHSVAHATEAVYGDYAIRHLCDAYRLKYFRPVGDKLAVGAKAKSLVKISRLNLLDEAGMAFMKGMDVIFCCNVLIYFDASSKKRVIRHFYDNLLPHGYFFLGHSESLFGINDDFRLVHFPSATGYAKGERRNGAGSRP